MLVVRLVDCVLSDVPLMQNLFAILFLCSFKTTFFTIFIISIVNLQSEISYCSENFQDEKTTEALKALHIISLRNPKNDEYMTFSDEIKEQLAMSTDPEVKIYEELVHPFLADYYDATLLLLYGIFR